jgi:hypothetical protein
MTTAPLQRSLRGGAAEARSTNAALTSRTRQDVRRNKRVGPMVFMRFSLTSGGGVNLRCRDIVADARRANKHVFDHRDAR